MTIRTFEEMRAHVAGRPPVAVAVAGGDEPNVMASIVAALEGGLIAFAAISGNPQAILANVPDALRERIRTLPADTPAAAAAAAVAEVRAGRAGLLIKGGVDSTSYLRAVLDHTSGIRGEGVLSNLTLAEMPSLPRLIGATDNGILPLPTLEQKRAILRNAAPLFRSLGLEQTRVAAIAATEKISDKQPATVDAAALTKESREGAFPGMIVDGPFGYDVAISRSAAETKGFADSPVAGAADLILFPNIESANATAKAWKYHGQAKTGSVILGAAAPMLLNSRSDGVERRILGMVIALCILSDRERA